jgi:hypothetical protein
VLLQEVDHAISHFKTRGPDVYADAGDIERTGRDSILSEMLRELGLNDADVDLKVDPPDPGEVDRMRQVVEDVRQRRNNAAEANPAVLVMSEEQREKRQHRARDAFDAVQRRLDDESSSRVLKLIEEQELAAAFKLMCAVIESRDLCLTKDEKLKLAWLADALNVRFALRRSARP